MPGISAPSVDADLYLIGITGSMGCGKSGVSAMLVNRGARLLDADAAARQVLEPGTPGWSAVVDRFGAGVLTGNEPPEERVQARRPLDRRRLGEHIFPDPRGRADLETIVHPRIRQLHARTLAGWQKKAGTAPVRIIVALEIPLLFETDSAHRFDLTVTVACGDRQWHRLADRTGMTATIKKRAIAQQLPEAEKIRLADRVIDNSGSREETERQVDDLWREIHQRAARDRRRAWPDGWERDLAQ